MESYDKLDDKLTPPYHHFISFLFEKNGMVVSHDEMFGSPLWLEHHLEGQILQDIKKCGKS